MVSIGRVVAFMSAVMEGVKWSKDMREQLKTMQRDVTSLTDHASYLSNKITFVLDAMLGVVNLEQNNIIKLFSVMAVMLMPPTLVASVYGMNFKVMPEMLAKEALAFATRYDSLDLLTWVNLFIDQTTLDGRMQSNLDYWVNSTKWKDEH